MLLKTLGYLCKFCTNLTAKFRCKFSLQYQTGKFCYKYLSRNYIENVLLVFYHKVLMCLQLNYLLDIKLNFGQTLQANLIGNFE